MLKKNKLILGFSLLLSGLLPASFALAQDFGVNAVNNTIALAQGDPRVLVGRIIQIVLSFLGVIILGLIIYAGFIWMTSGGEEEKVSQAKKILKNAVIGLVITLSAWAITTFLLTKLTGTISGTNNSQPGETVHNLTSSGFGAMGACTVESVYPENNQRDVARNASIIMTFKEEINLNSVCVNSGGSACACDNASCALLNPKTVRIFKSDLGDACTASCPTPNSNVADVSVSISSDKKTIVLTPLSYLGSQDSNTNYDIKVTSDLKKADGSSMFTTCSQNLLQWGFEVSTKLDLTPPQVLAGLIYPQPDNIQDTIGVSTSAKNANAEIFVSSCPKIFTAASVVSVTPDATASLDYHGAITKFKVVVPSGAPTKGQLFNSSNNTLLGVADFDEQSKIVFKDYLTLDASSNKEGDSWDITIIPEQIADTLTVGQAVYLFSDTDENNKILVSSGNCDLNVQASNIRAKLSGNYDIDVSLLGNKVLLVAKVAGSSGNKLALTTSNNNALHLTSFSGGSDLQVNNIVGGKKDSPMNSIIRVSFNEAINPLTLSGTASEVSNYIKVINASSTSLVNGSSCNANSDCRSYKCEGNICRGDYVNGRFVVSGGYRNVEFISDNECGINGCGEKMYCLPPNSNLAVELNASNLRVCGSDQDCVALAPFRTCSLGVLGYKTCQDTNQRNYPSANPLILDGVIDTALNSLDGNRDKVADGPINFFNENFSSNTDRKDSYKFSFFINDKIESTPPKITSITPNNSQGDINLTEPIEITFNNLMMSSTLSSGGQVVTVGNNTVEHRFINLRTSEPSPIGYWVSNESKDVNPLDGVADITVAKINHSPFLESITYNAQVGSGVKDIFQNCFKPSIGPNCEATPESPSCCFGVATSALLDGNCN